MEIDRLAYEGSEGGQGLAMLRTYTWEKPCITIGYRQKPEAVKNPVKLEIVSRPTGGGVVYHQPGELTYSLVLPLDYPGLPKSIQASCNYLSEAILNALIKSGIDAELFGKKGTLRSDLCFAAAEAYEIVYEGKKIVGSAQRRGRKALLQQGTFKCDLPNDFNRRLVEEFKMRLNVQ